MICTISSEMSQEGTPEGACFSVYARNQGFLLEAQGGQEQDVLQAFFRTRFACCYLVFASNVCSKLNLKSRTRET